MVSGDDEIRNGQPQARADADFFRSEKRLEHALADLLRHPRPIIFDFDVRHVVVAPRPQRNRWFCGGIRLRHHRLRRVDEQVDHDLLNLIFLAANFRQRRIILAHDPAAFQIIPLLEIVHIRRELHGAINQFAHVMRFVGRPGASAEIQHVRHDFFGAFPRVLN